MSHCTCDYHQEQNKKGSLSTIIEKKKDEFAFFLDGMGFSAEEIETILPQAEKAIRESVEEALREVRPEDSSECSALYMDRIKEFMK